MDVPHWGCHGGGFDVLKLRLADGFTSFQVVPYGKQDNWWNCWLPMASTIKILLSQYLKEFMYPWRSSVILKRYILSKTIRFGKRIPLVPKTFGCGSNHFSSLISSSKTFESFETHPPSHCLIACVDVDDVMSWCWTCWYLRELIRAQVIRISVSVSETLFI